MLTLCTPKTVSTATVLLDVASLNQADPELVELAVRQARTMSQECQGAVVVQVICGDVCCYELSDPPFLADTEAEFIILESVRPAA